MKWCGVYSNPWIIKDCFRMCTAFHLGTYVNLYSFERSIWKNLFSFELNRNLLLQITLNLRYAKNVIRKADYGARKLCLFPKTWWNFNVVKIILIFYSLFSTKYIAFLYYWSAWFEASVKDIKSNYVIHGMGRESRWFPLWLTDLIRYTNALCVFIEVRVISTQSIVRRT